MRAILATNNSYALLIARLALGLVMFPHGAQKALGWFSGPGLSGTVGFMSSIGLAVPLPYLAVLAEFGGAIALVFGLFGRVAALGVGIVMVVAAVTVHLANGFFMNWNGNQAGEGYEYHILALGLALAIMIGGSGALSLDRLLARGKR